MRRTHGRTGGSSATLFRAGVVVAATALVGLLGRRVSGREPTRLDKRVRRKVRSHDPKATRVAALGVSLFGYPVVYIPAALLIAERLSRRGKRGGNALVGAALGGWLVHRAIKQVVVRTRPPTQSGDSNAHRAFPSGHTTGITSFALTGAYVLYRDDVLPASLAATLAAGLPFAMGMSRVYADEHWMTDVFAGWATGSAVAAIAIEAYHRTSE